jgi:predicted Zn finger-like uncharacterized protein
MGGELGVDHETGQEPYLDTSDERSGRTDMTIVCPACGQRYGAPEKLAGKRVRCQKCGTLIAVPEIADNADLTLEEDVAPSNVQQRNNDRVVAVREEMWVMANRVLSGGDLPVVVFPSATPGDPNDIPVLGEATMNESGEIEASK